MTDELARQQALVVLESANRHLEKGEIADAILSYRRSLGLWPTAEAYVGLGQAYGLTQRHDEAIACCHKAIATDPTLGRAYNDIGVYLIDTNRWEEAIPWLEEATRSAGYETPRLAYFNLGRVYTHLGQYATASKHLEQAIELDPFHRPAVWAKFALLAKMN